MKLIFKPANLFMNNCDIEALVKHGKLLQIRFIKSQSGKVTEAYLFNPDNKSDKSIFATGDNACDAIGRLLLTHHNIFGISIINEGVEKD